MKDKSSKIIVLMVDGFGVPPEGWDASIFAKYGGRDFVNLFKEHSKPIDACIGVEGIPQSATGQSTLFSGINTAQLMGRHMPGFPSQRLREIIRQQNIFKAFTEYGKKVTFANAYVHFTLEELEKMGAESVTTVMTAETLGSPRQKDDLIKEKAVYHDLTRASVDPCHNIEQVKPSKAAKDLLSIATNNDLTLFEYFLSDRAGHKGEEEFIARVIGEFSEFLCALSKELPPDTLLVMTSDHGNCENIKDKRHTRNQVPFLVFGKMHPDTSQVNSITDVYNFLLDLR